MISTATAQVGSTGFSLLNLTPNPRSMALGKASTAIFDDVSTVYWNPAAITTSSNPRLSANYRRIIDDTYFVNFQAILPFDRGGVGLEFSYLSFGQTSIFQGGEQRQTTTPYEFSLGVSGSFAILSWLQVGLTGKWIKEQLLNSIEGNGVSFDVGIFFYRPFSKIAFLKHLSTSLVLAHLGIGPTYFQHPTTLPNTFRWGLIYSLPFIFSEQNENQVDKSSVLNFILDINFAFQASVEVGGGIEWILPRFDDWVVTLRVGYKQVTGTDFLIGLTGGAGLNWRNLEVNYGIASQGEIGFNHFIGVGYKLLSLKKKHE